MIDKVPINNDQATEAAKTLFAEDTYWRVLDPEDTDIDNPTTSTNFHAPTVGND